MKSLFVLIILFIHSNLFSQIFWDEMVTGVSVQLNSVSNVNGMVAWACGQNATVVRTSNNGYNWVSVGSNGIPTATVLVNIFGIDANNAITAGYVGANTFVYRTSNGGVNWIQVFTQTNGFINGVWMTSNLNGFMQGDPVGGRWSLWKTTNGGVNWDSVGVYLQQSGSEAGWNNSLFITGNRIWFGTNNTRIYYSSNYGINWIIQSTAPETNTYSIGLDTLSPYLGFSGGATLLKSTAAGINWTQISAPGTGNINGVATQTQFLPYTWYVRGNTVYYSPNQGSSWFTQYTSSSGNYTHIAKTRGLGSSSILYATKTNGGISRGNLFVEGVRLISNEIPQNFGLYQNYPNPFNPSTKIVFNLTKLQSINAGDIRGAFVALKVYDLLGKEVADLHNKVIQPGTYEAEWNASNMPSGMYFYRLIVSDLGSSKIVYSESRKMVLLK